MSAQEFVGWQAFSRREPFGFPWWNWAMSWLAFIVDRNRPRSKNERKLAVEDFEWKPPAPLFTRPSEKHRD